jgi:hypothetical protein
MLLIFKDLKSYLRSSMLSFRLGRNLSSYLPPLEKEDREEFLE